MSTNLNSTNMSIDNESTSTTTQQSITCYNCRIPLDDALILSCDHNLCLRCAHDRLKFCLSHGHPQGSLFCQKCSKLTMVDMDSINHLNELFSHQNTPLNLMPNTHKTPQTLTSHRNSFIQNNSPQIQSQNISFTNHYQRNNTQSNHVCPNHPEEIVQFYCSSCGGDCFCAECLLSVHSHATHLDKVLSLKNALKFVNNKLMDYNISQVEEDIHKGNRRIQEKIADLHHENQNLSIEVTNTFDRLIKSIEVGRDKILSKIKNEIYLPISASFEGIKQDLDICEEELRVGVCRSTMTDIEVINSYSKLLKIVQLIEQRNEEIYRPMNMSGHVDLVSIREFVNSTVGQIEMPRDVITSVKSPRRQGGISGIKPTPDVKNSDHLRLMQVMDDAVYEYGF